MEMKRMMLLNYYYKKECPFSLSFYFLRFFYGKRPSPGFLPCGTFPAPSPAPPPSPLWAGGTWTPRCRRGEGRTEGARSTAGARLLVGEKIVVSITSEFHVIVKYRNKSWFRVFIFLKKILPDQNHLWKKSTKNLYLQHLCMVCGLKKIWKSHPINIVYKWSSRLVIVWCLR